MAPAVAQEYGLGDADTAERVRALVLGDRYICPGDVMAVSSTFVLSWLMAQIMMIGYN